MYAETSQQGRRVTTVSTVKPCCDRQCEETGARKIRLYIILEYQSVCNIRKGHFQESLAPLC